MLAMTTPARTRTTATMTIIFLALIAAFQRPPLRAGGAVGKVGKSPREQYQETIRRQPCLRSVFFPETELSSSTGRLDKGSQVAWGQTWSSFRIRMMISERIVRLPLVTGL